MARIFHHGSEPVRSDSVYVVVEKRQIRGKSDVLGCPRQIDRSDVRRYFTHSRVKGKEMSLPFSLPFQQDRKSLTISFFPFNGVGDEIFH